MSRETIPLTFRPMQATEQDASSFGACFAAEGQARALEAIRWQYLENPAAAPIVHFAVDPTGEAEAEAGEGSIAGIYAVQMVRMRVDGELRLAAQSVDTLVGSAYRGQGLFVRLAEQTYRRCAEAGVDFVYGFPNGNSAHGFFNRLGWSTLDPVPFMIRPLRIGFALSKLGLELPRLGDLRLPCGRPRLEKDEEFRDVMAFGPEFDALWGRFAEGIGVAIERDAQYLRWRCRDKPGHRYQTIGLYRAGQLVAYAILIVANKHGGRVGYLLELLHAPGDRRAGDAVMRAALGRMSALGADAALAWNLPGSPNRGSHLRAGFLPLPERLRPIELHFGVLGLRPPEPRPLANRASWYLSYCDSDTV
ncbi:MAG: GNAT family N-acetyltransferase [Myxococcales bacterium]|nr:GNAT family N-acetyltransferase [Myxococcales bacterium]